MLMFVNTICIPCEIIIHVYFTDRLTAPYLFTIGVVEVSMKWFYYNSVFEPPAMDHENCPNYWWRNVLYINTLFPAPEMVRRFYHNGYIYFL